MKLLIQNIKNLTKKENINYLLVFLFFVVLFSFIYFTVPKIISLDDPLFYIKYSQMIREQGLSVINNFHWIYFADNTRFGMLYSLFNFVLIPFTFFPELWMGIKYFAVFGASVVMFIIYWWFRKIKISYAFFLLLVLWSISPISFVMRTLYTRPFILMMIIGLLEIYCLWRKRYIFVVLLAFLHIFNHGNTFYLPSFFAFVFFIFSFLHSKKFDWRLIFSSFFGTILGMVILPNFPKNFLIMFKVVFNIYVAVLGKSQVQIQEGVENYGVNVFDFIFDNYLFLGILFGFLFLRIVYYFYQVKNKETESGRLNFFSTDKEILILNDSLFFINIFSLVGFIFTRRVSDFWFPLIIIYFALSIKLISPYFKIFINENFKKIILTSGKILFFVILIYLVGARAMALNYRIANASSPVILEKTAKWLNDNTGDKDIIFLDNWSYFPNLFYYNTKNYYTMGMEPRFLYDYNPELYLYWTNIVSRGLPCNKVDCQEWLDQINGKKSDEAIKILDKGVAEIIFKKFKSQYILTSVSAGNFYVILKKSQYFEQVFQDEEFTNFTVFKIKTEILK